MPASSSSHALFEEFFELVPDATLGVGPDGTILLANQLAISLFGYDKDDLLSRSVDDLVPMRFRRGHTQSRLEYFDNPRPRRMGTAHDFFALRADGSEFPADISVATGGSPDEPIAVVSVRDISERIGSEARRHELEAEVQLNQSRRLESVGQLAGGIAHDFNNLLGVIINYAGFVYDELEDRPELREDIEQVRGAADRAAALIRQLLIFSRREIVKPEPVNLNTTLIDLGKLLPRVLGEQVEVHTNFEPELWTVIADPGQVEQVAVNLAVNARDAMPEGGVLDIETSNVELGPEYVATHPDVPTPGRYVRVTVADSGVGMDPETLERAFEPFYTTKPHGTGLGLATVYGIVKKAGGNVFLYSEPNRGTSVKIHLPAVDAPVEPQTSTDESRPKGSGERILVIEDEEAVRKLVVRILSKNGYEVVDFDRGSEAIALLEETDQQFDLVLTDIVMPEMQGGEIAQTLSLLRPQVPVMFMSGYSERILAKDLVGEDFSHFIEKPFTSQKLLQHVDRVLR